MYKRLFIAIVVLLPVLSLRAQVNLALQVPPAGVMMKGQLWNMALVYTGNGGINVAVNLTLMGTRDNQPVLTAQSRTVMLSKGTNMLTVKDLGPIQYNYISPAFNIDRDPDGFLPIGNYKACYTVSAVGTHENGILAEDCLPVEVQPLSPPQLNTPADTATLETAYPQFSWLPPMPVNLFSNLSYDMLVVEVQPGQGSYEAIQKNIPVYNISRYRDQANLYPTSNVPLDTGRIYAWRVIAKNEDEFVSQSEVWTFHIASHKPTTVKVPDGNYISLHAPHEQSTAMQVLSDNILGIKYYSFDKDHEATISFLNSEGQIIKTLQQKILYGNNFLGFLLDGIFQKGKIYKVVVSDLQNIPHSAIFMIKSSKQ